MPHLFPDQSAQPGGRPSICIVTSELIGPFNNGGIGTSMTGLAQTLAASGFPVTVLYTGGHLETETERGRWRSLYAGIGITLVWLVDFSGDRLRGPLARCGFAVPWHVYDYLQARSFDVVHFNDCMGEGFYCLAARRLGTAFRDTSLFVALHSPSQWIFEMNRALPSALLHAAFNYAERLSVKSADVLWGPSRYLIDWARENGFEPPAGTYVQKYVLPALPLFGPSAPAAAPAGEAVRPREIVFFGRLEERKGLRIFCEALNILNGMLCENGIKVTFLGKEGTVGDRPALDYLSEQAVSWRFENGVIATYGQQEAVEHLRSGTAVAVMASPADNSPCTLYEAMTLGIPFVAARTGGIPELVDERDREEALFEPNAEALAERLTQAIRRGIAPARAADAPDAIGRRWVSAFESHRELARPVPPRSRRLASVLAVVDAPAGTDVSATLASMADVTGIIVVCRGARPDIGAATAPVTFVEAHRPEGLSAALSETDAEAVLFLRGGVILAPGAIAALGQLLECPEADGAVPAATAGPDEKLSILPPLGSSQSFCFYEGPLPGGALLLKQARLAPLLGSFAAVTEAEFLGIPDHAIAGGLEIWPFPDALVRHPAGVVADPFGGRAAERIRAYSQVPAIERYYISAIGHECFEQSARAAPVLNLVRDRMIGWRLGWMVRFAKRTLPQSIIRLLRRRR